MTRRPWVPDELLPVLRQELQDYDNEHGEFPEHQWAGLSAWKHLTGEDTSKEEWERGLGVPPSPPVDTRVWTAMHRAAADYLPVVCPQCIKLSSVKRTLPVEGDWCCRHCGVASPAKSYL